MPIVTLLTDFGDMDGFVGAMRGVLLSRAPDARLVDLAHHVPPGDIEKGAQVLARAAPCFPAGTVHLVVIDPGVGSARRPLAVRAGGHTFVGPDNGVFTDVIEALEGVAAAHVLENRGLWRPVVGSTFHGRDVFAPVAGALAAGAPIDVVGPPAGPLVRLDRSPPRRDADGHWHGRIVEVDRYGNLSTNLQIPIGPGGRVRVFFDGGVLDGPASAYAEVPPGAPVLVVNSRGALEIAVRDASAASRFRVGVGGRVTCVPVGAPGAWPP